MHELPLIKFWRENAIKRATGAQLVELFNNEATITQIRLASTIFIVGDT